MIHMQLLQKLWEPFTQELLIPAKGCSVSSAHPKKHKHICAQTFLFSSSSFYCSGPIKIYDLSTHQDLSSDLLHEAFCCSMLGNS
ncbi:hypothetical protein Nmel_017607 [Mimus melanotis]